MTAPARGYRVQLTDKELAYAGEIGVVRHLKAKRRGRADKFPCKPKEIWGTDIWGAAAELAFAKAGNYYWPAATDPDRAGDVAGYHVRWRSESDRDLVVLKTGPRPAWYVLVVNIEHTFWIIGTMDDARAMVTRYWKKQGDNGIPSAAFYIPQGDLDAWEPEGSLDDARG